MRYLGYLFCILNLTACAGLKTPTEKTNPEPPFLSLQNFLQDQKVRVQTLEKAQGKAHIRFSDSKNSVFGESRLVRFLDRTRLDIKDPMGRIRFWILGDEEGLLIYEEDIQTAWRTSRESPLFFRKRFGIDLSWKELQELWLGILPRSWLAGKEPIWEKKSDIYEGVLVGKMPIRFWVDENSQQLMKIFWNYQKRDYQIVFSDWDACTALEGQKKLLAHRVEMNLPGELSKFELEWEELNLLEEIPNDLNFKRALPKGTRLIPLVK